MRFLDNLLSRKAWITSFLIFVLIESVFLRVCSEVFGSSRFNKSIWFAPVTEKTEGDCYRGGMAADIKANWLPAGLPQSSVVKLLGKPDWSSSVEFQYVLGMCSGMGIDYDNLHIYFDSNKKVIHVAILQH